MTRDILEQKAQPTNSDLKEAEDIFDKLSSA